MTINNLNKFVVRYFEDQALVRAKALFRLCRELSRTIRPSLTPALRLGLVGIRHTGALALMASNMKLFLLFIVNPLVAII